jgi:hypothetical protein
MSSDLVPADVDTDLVAPFLSLTLTLLDLVAQDPVVKHYTSTGMDAREVIRVLCTSGNPRRRPAGRRCQLAADAPIESIGSPYDR